MARRGSMLSRPSRRDTPPVRWVQASLARGPRRASDVLRDGAAAGFPARILRYALKGIGYSMRRGFGPGAVVYWLLTEDLGQWSFPATGEPEFAPIGDYPHIGARLADLERVIVG